MQYNIGFPGFSRISLKIHGKTKKSKKALLSPSIIERILKNSPCNVTLWISHKIHKEMEKISKRHSLVRLPAMILCTLGMYSLQANMVTYRGRIFFGMYLPNIFKTTNLNLNFSDLALHPIQLHSCAAYLFCSFYKYTL